MIRRLTLCVHGTVQGVGFRPFVDRLAHACNISGTIRNTSRGVMIQAQGAPQALARFLTSLCTDAPPLARMQRIDASPCAVVDGEDAFLILPSTADSAVRTQIAPDTATCPACVNELLDPANRRYRCAFINCTDCGPRFTIIHALPYDRTQTTMADFPLCDDCREEFTDITSRRYHAQPICCNDCGPALTLLDAAGSPMQGDPILQTQRILSGNGVVAVKGIGGFHLACIPTPQAVQTLRQRKHRAAKPLALMCRDLKSARRYCRIDEDMARLLQSPARPIVLCPKQNIHAWSDLSENSDLGILLPYAPIHHLLFDGAPFDALVMTSANASGLPLIKDNAEATRLLSGIADGFLLHNRDIAYACDDSLAYTLHNAPYFVRRSRGYVPGALCVHDAPDSLLAFGAQQKATFCLSRNEQAFCGPHIGDLTNIETLAFFQAHITHLCALLDIQPKACVCDLHPDYLSTHAAQEFSQTHDIPLLRVQHHHAHFAACMADNLLEGDALGIVWDGTGLGDDGTIWGGEFLSGNFCTFQRHGSIAPFPLCGGDLAAREPARAAAGILYAANADIPALFCAGAAFVPQLAANIHCPVATSVGRLFDGIATLTGLNAPNLYSGRAAMRLQALAAQSHAPRRYHARLYDTPDGRFCLNTNDMFLQAAQDIAHGAQPCDVAEGFHRYLADGALLACRRMRQQTGLSRVLLSGGVFLNLRLVALLWQRLTDDGFAVFHHRRVSCSDEGLSLGQMMIAQRRLSHVSGSTASDCIN